MSRWDEADNRILPPDASAIATARAKWDAIAKPLGSLGLLEDAIVKIAGLTGSADIVLCKRAVIIMCADNGVVCEGVTQTGQEITALVAGNMAKGLSSVCHMASVAGAEVIPVDIGMANDAGGVLYRRISRGTSNITEGPAMCRAQAERAIQTGIELAGEYKKRGYDILATGEMGIGNTTTASAVTAALLKLPADSVTGRGAGLSDAGLSRKICAVRRALEVNQPNESDALDVLSKVGGYDIAGMAGLFIGGAIFRIPVLIDGFISASAALAAVRLAPGCRHAMLASHISAEPASRLLLGELGVKPLICAEMRLGEGTGAVCALPLLDMALSVYNGMATFGGVGMEAYTRQGGEG